MAALMQMLGLRRMTMGMLMLMRQLRVRGLIGIRNATVIQNIHLRRRDTTAIDLLDTKRRSNIESAYCIFEHGSGNARIEQGSLEHIAGSSGKAFEIGETHEPP